MEEIIEPRFLAELRSMRDILPELLQTLQRDFHSRLDSMRKAVADNDPETLSQMAHGVKGAAGNLGGRELAALCQELEQKGRAGTVEGAEAFFSTIEREYARLYAALEQIAEEEE